LTTETNCFITHTPYTAVAESSSYCKSLSFCS